MKLRLWQVDAFTDRVFGGNPAAVCQLEEWLPDITLQSIAGENNLSETAFFVGRAGNYELRWFTPTVEVDLCGHATLASAYMIFEHVELGRQQVVFQTRKAGVLTVERQADLLSMDFPARPAKPIAAMPALNAALGASPVELRQSSRDHLAVYSSAADVLALKPDFAALAKLDCWAVIVTAPGENGVDFVSRFFGPAQGVNEDPVTGSAHCTLIPYWAERLGKSELLAHQVSQRGGVLKCKILGDRVNIAGQAVLYMEGKIALA